MSWEYNLNPQSSNQNILDPDPCTGRPRLRQVQPSAAITILNAVLRFSKIRTEMESLSEATRGLFVTVRCGFVCRQGWTQIRDAEATT